VADDDEKELDSRELQTFIQHLGPLTQSLERLTGRMPVQGKRKTPRLSDRLKYLAKLVREELEQDNVKGGSKKAQGTKTSRKGKRGGGDEGLGEDEGKGVEAVSQRRTSGRLRMFPAHVRAQLQDTEDAREPFTHRSSSSNPVQDASKPSSSTNLPSLALLEALEASDAPGDDSSGGEEGRRMPPGSRKRTHGNTSELNLFLKALAEVALGDEDKKEGSTSVRGGRATAEGGK